MNTNTTDLTSEYTMVGWLVGWLVIIAISLYLKRGTENLNCSLIEFMHM